MAPPGPGMIFIILVVWFWPWVCAIVLAGLIISGIILRLISSYNKGFNQGFFMRSSTAFLGTVLILGCIRLNIIICTMMAFRVSTRAQDPASCHQMAETYYHHD
jgi:hypothetical protein